MYTLHTHIYNCLARNFFFRLCFFFFFMNRTFVCCKLYKELNEIKYTHFTHTGNILFKLRFNYIEIIIYWIKWIGICNLIDVEKYTTSNAYLTAINGIVCRIAVVIVVVVIEKPREIAVHGWADGYYRDHIPVKLKRKNISSINFCQFNQTQKDCDALSPNSLCSIMDLKKKNNVTSDSFMWNAIGAIRDFPVNIYSQQGKNAKHANITSYCIN